MPRESTLSTGQGQIQWSRVDVFCAPSDLKLGIPGAQRKTCGAGTNHPLAVETENPGCGGQGLSWSPCEHTPHQVWKHKPWRIKKAKRIRKANACKP